MSLYTTLSIAKQGLYTAQLGLQITAQNIANVNTPGYKRQQLIQANMPYGLGVTVQAIDRNLDVFAEKRLIDVTSDSARSSLTSMAYRELESLFNEVADRGLDAEFEDFFASLQDLSSRPSGSAERSTLRSQGESIGHLFEFFSQQMEEQGRNQDLVIDNGIAKANAIVDSIAELNQQIAESMQNKIGVNELKNERDEWVRQLAELMPVTVSEDENGNYSLFIEKGMPLVAGAQAYHLRAQPDVTNDLKKNIVWMSNENVKMDVTHQISSGSLGAALEIRDEIVPEQMERLDRLAAEFVMAFNEQHRAGTGLDGVSGRNFFEALPVYTRIGQGSDGGVGVSSAVVTDETLLTLDKYEVRFTTASDYELVNTTTGASITSGVYTPGMTLTFDGIQVSFNNVSGPPQAGDYFQIDTVSEASKNVRISAAVTSSLDAIAAGYTSGTGDNQNALELADLENKSIVAGGT
ncbi:flagellar hook-associated protein FlgK, partial [bacterium]|nr:flagellar hook-associated protein FlgK [bacterium]